MGIWDLESDEEFKNALHAASNPAVLGFCVGNEGLNIRYDLTQLESVIYSLQKQSNKPVTTSEQIEDYSLPELLALGDWIFPNVHPYFNNQITVEKGVDWTVAAFNNLQAQTSKDILFKEVGFPTAGDSINKMDEMLQDDYYYQLAKTDVDFVYFEAFDQPWKDHLPIEPFWGVFDKYRQPKKIALRLMGAKPAKATFYIYKDSKLC